MGNKRITLSRPQVAALLSMTEGEVRRLDGDRLHPHKGPDGGWLYGPAEVVGVLRQFVLVTGAVPTGGIDMAASAEGGIAADAFSRFEKNEGAARVVIELRLNPVLVRDLRRTYDAMTREITVSSADRQEIERITGRAIAGGRDIVVAISQLAKSRSAVGRAVHEPSLPEDEEYGAVVDPETGEKRVLTKEEAERSMSSLTKRWSKGEGTRPTNAVAGASVEEQWAFDVSSTEEAP